MPNKEAVKGAWEKEPIICKLVDFGESRASMIQMATVCSTQTTNIDRGTPVYMAPDIAFACGYFVISGATERV